MGSKACCGAWSARSRFRGCDESVNSGFSEFVYPGATHSRFIHSLGVFHTARQLMRIVDLYAPKTPAEKIQREAALAAALVHDVGHGPFSHAFELIGKKFAWNLISDHENHSEALIRSTAPGGIGEVLNGYRPGFADTVANVLRRGPETVYGSIVSSQFDADRLDYVRRDRLMTGTRLAGIDFEWLLANLEIGDLPRPRQSEVPRRRTFVLGPKANYAAETFVVGLFQMYPTVYLHKTTRGAEKLAQFALTRVAELVRGGNAGATGLPDNHPLVSLFERPDDLVNFADVDDTSFLGALPMLCQSADAKISEFSERIRTRRFFKAIDLLGMPDIELPKKSDERYEKRCLRIRAGVEQRVEDWAQDGARQGRVLLDYADRRPYKRIDEELSMNHIWIREGASLVPLREQSEAVAATGTFIAFRAYVSEDDDEARRFVVSCVREAAKEE